MIPSDSWEWLVSSIGQAFVESNCEALNLRHIWGTQLDRHQLLVSSLITTSKPFYPFYPFFSFQSFWFEYNFAEKMIETKNSFPVNIENWCHQSIDRKLYDSWLASKPMFFNTIEIWLIYEILHWILFQHLIRQKSH